MSDDEPRQGLENAISELGQLEPQLRDSAFRAVSAYVQYIYAAASGGAGPIALPPSPPGSSPTTKGTFKCPNCGHNGTAQYT